MMKKTMDELFQPRRGKNRVMAEILKKNLGPSRRIEYANGLILVGGSTENHKQKEQVRPIANEPH